MLWVQTATLPTLHFLEGKLFQQFFMQLCLFGTLCFLFQIFNKHDLKYQGVKEFHMLARTGVMVKL